MHADRMRGSLHLGTIQGKATPAVDGGWGGGWGRGWGWGRKGAGAGGRSKTRGGGVQKRKKQITVDNNHWVRVAEWEIKVDIIACLRPVIEIIIQSGTYSFRGIRFKVQANARRKYPCGSGK